MTVTRTSDQARDPSRTRPTNERRPTGLGGAARWATVLALFVSIVFVVGVQPAATRVRTATAATVNAQSAATTCTGDVCVVDGGTVSTPLGIVTVSVTAADVVTVSLIPNVSNVVVVGVPVAVPPGPPGRAGYSRATIATVGGVVNIDTLVIAPGPQARVAPPDLAVISIHPPGPCRARTSGDTVTFTPILTPSPPGSLQQVA